MRAGDYDRDRFDLDCDSGLYVPSRTRRGIERAHPQWMFGGMMVGAGAFDPRDIAGCLIWLDANDASTLSLSTLDVNSWTSKASGGKVFTAGATKPALNSSYFVNPCVDFGSAGSCYVNNATGVSIPAANTVFMVMYWGARSNTTMSLSLQAGTSSNALQANAGLPFWTTYTAANGSGIFQMARTGGIDAHTTSPIHAKGARGLYTLKVNTAMATAELRFNGGVQSKGTTGASWTTGAVNTLGATDTTYVANGAFAEVLVYDSFLSAGDVAKVEAYLKDKWGTP